MGMDLSKYLAMEARLASNRKRAEFVEAAAGVPVDKESKLFDAIDEWCNGQWPQWVQVYARTDKKSTLPVGCHDRTIFGPFPKCVLVEGKRGNEKPDKDQLIWHKRLEMLGWKVHVIRSAEEFMELVK